MSRWILFQWKRKRLFDGALSGEIIARGGLLHSFAGLLFVVFYVVVSVVVVVIVDYS